MKSFEPFEHYCDIGNDIKNTLALILAGGRGTRLKELTQWRVKPAVPFGGKFRIIDFVLSNLVNSDIRKIGILTQYKSQSLIRHVMRGWELLRSELDEFIECVPAQKRLGENWYTGTADAIYQNIDLVQFYNPKYVMILAGDHIYKMDYRHMLAFHKSSKADLTVGCIDVPLEEARRFGIMSVNEQYRITGFQEKPEHPVPMPDRDDRALASMGIYIFNTSFLVEQLLQDAKNEHSSHDFGKDIIPPVIESNRIYAYPFIDFDNNLPFYWRDVGTVDSYWEASMELIGVSPELNLYDMDWPIRTSPHHYPSAKFVFNENGRQGKAVDSIVSEGCIVSGADVQHSLLSTNVRVEEQSFVKDSVILPNVSIGPRCRITNAIIDKECEIPEGTVIGEDPEEDRRRFDVSPGGIVLVEPEMLGQKIHQIE
jgi:glucose-1-phosphate adenylyltransferase